MQKFANVVLVAASLLVQGDATGRAIEGPGELTVLIRGSDVIEVATFEGTEPQPTIGEGGQILRFRLLQSLQGDPKVKIVTFAALPKSVEYGILHNAKRVLLFLKENKDGNLEPTRPFSFIRLEGENENLSNDLERYLAMLRNRYKGEKEGQAFRTFVIEELTASKSEYFRRSMAEDLLTMVDGVRSPGFTEQDAVAIAKAALSEESFPVVVPMCLVLDKLNSEKTDECIQHALLNASINNTSVRLAEVIGAREQLVKKLFANLENMTDVKQSRRLSLAVNHLYLVPDPELLPGIKSLWQKNPNARSAITGILGGGRSKERNALLRELTGKE